MHHMCRDKPKNLQPRWVQLLWAKKECIKLDKAVVSDTTAIKEHMLAWERTESENDPLKTDFILAGWKNPDPCGWQSGNLKQPERRQ